MTYKDKPFNEYIQSLCWRHQNSSPQSILRDCIKNEFNNQIALLSSFGTESIVLLHMISLIDRSLPVLFLDTWKLFPKTLLYRDEVIEKLDLQNVRILTPEKEDAEREDPLGTLWQEDPDRCCTIRKVKPLAKAMENFRAQINGRKRYHGYDRSALPLFNGDGDKVQVNPLVAWKPEKIKDYMNEHNLPQHPLTKQGYTSIGCIPCTAKPLSEDDVRSGRWPDQQKKECGIHYLYKNKHNSG